MESIHLTETFNTSAQTIFEAWLDSVQHSKMTGGEAKCSDRVGEEFTAWDGYITGENLEIVPNEKIVQTWRTSEFSPEDQDSILTIELKEVGNTTELTLTHTNIPKGQTQYHQGWINHYLNPMKAYFENK